jgi:hypothetical protein
VFDVLTAARDALADVPGVHTCKIGMESTLTPADYPIVRIVPTKLSESLARLTVRKAECLIYFGVAVHEFDDGLEALYSQLMEREAQILTTLRALGTISVRHIETIMDEDRVDAFKLMALRVSLEGKA